MATAYYNEIDEYAAAWLRNLISAGLLPAGDVDTRSIIDVRPEDLAGYRQCHFFAGLGGWGHALRLAGWPDDRPIWTGSCPCQPFSVAGKGAGVDDPRHLWPHFFRLIRACRPPVVMGEQVAGQAGYGWFDGVVSDLAAEGYASRGVDIPACAVDAPHIRSRLYWVAVADARGSERWPLAEGRGDDDDRHDAGREKEAGGSELGGATGFAVAYADELGAREGREQRGGQQRGAGGDQEARAGGALAHGHGSGQPDERGAGLRRADVHDADGRGERVDVGDTLGAGLEGRTRHGDDRDQSGRIDPQSGRSTAASGGRDGTPWSDHVWLVGADGKARRAFTSVRLLAHGIPCRVGRLRAYGNAIVPALAAEVIAAFMETAA